MATKVIPKLVAMLKTDDCCTSAEVLCSLEGGGLFRGKYFVMLCLKMSQLHLRSLQDPTLFLLCLEWEDLESGLK